MKYIDKHYDTDVVAQHNKELKDQQLDEKSLLQRKAQGETLNQKDLYALIRSREVIPNLSALLNQMNKEQGGICCYCGGVLRFPDTQHYSLEHVKPRTKYVELVGEYKNLLLSCHLSEQEHKDIQDEVNAMNLKRRKDRQNEKRIRFHCDEHKDCDEISITPLDKDCDELFVYKIDGTVDAKNGEQRAKDTIDILNLNCKTLVKQRKKAIENIVFSEDVDLKSLSQVVMNKLPNGMYSEFCFVINDVVNNLLK